MSQGIVAIPDEYVMRKRIIEPSAPHFPMTALRPWSYSSSSVTLMYVKALMSIIAMDRIGSVQRRIWRLPLVSTTVIAMIVPSVRTTLRGRERMMAAVVSSIFVVSKPACSIRVGP